MTEEDVKDPSEEGEQECWFKEGGCLEMSEMESGSWRNCNYENYGTCTQTLTI